MRFVEVEIRDGKVVIRHPDIGPVCFEKGKQIREILRKLGVELSEEEVGDLRVEVADRERVEV